MNLQAKNRRAIQALEAKAKSLSPDMVEDGLILRKILEREIKLSAPQDGQPFWIGTKLLHEEGPERHWRFLNALKVAILGHKDVPGLSLLQRIDKDLAGTAKEMRLAQDLRVEKTQARQKDRRLSGAQRRKRKAAKGGNGPMIFRSKPSSDSKF